MRLTSWPLSLRARVLFRRNETDWHRGRRRARHPEKGEEGSAKPDLVLYVKPNPYPAYR